MSDVNTGATEPGLRRRWFERTRGHGTPGKAQMGDVSNCRGWEVSLFFMTGIYNLDFQDVFFCMFLLDIQIFNLESPNSAYPPVNSS